MTAARSSASPPAFGPTQSGHRVRFAAAQLSTTTVLVRVDGDVDACNAPGFVAFTERHVAGGSELILDLSRLSFFGTQGFSALHQINVICSREAVNWVLVPSADVNRVLAVCDPAGGLPVADSVEEAAVVLRRGPRNHLTVVPPDL